MFNIFEKAITSKEILYFGVPAWQYELLVNAEVSRRSLM